MRRKLIAFWSYILQCSIFTTLMKCKLLSRTYEWTPNLYGGQAGGYCGLAVRMNFCLYFEILCVKGAGRGAVWARDGGKGVAAAAGTASANSFVQLFSRSFCSESSSSLLKLRLKAARPAPDSLSHRRSTTRQVLRVTACSNFT